MSDTFDVTATFDKTSYNQGDLITLTLSGKAVMTTTSTGSVGPLSITVTDANSVTTMVTVAAVPATFTIATDESVKMLPGAIVDSGTPPRNWAISANGLVATSTA
jgi:hypothetical protein